MHEAAVYYRLVFQHNLVAVTALHTLLVLVALVATVLHLLEVPYNAKFSGCYNYVTLLFPFLRYLETQEPHMLKNA